MPFFDFDPDDTGTPLPPVPVSEPDAPLLRPKPPKARYQTPKAPYQRKRRAETLGVCPVSHRPCGCLFECALNPTWEP